jgi:hypothetical protein
MKTETPNVLAAVWTSAYVDSLPDSSFAFVDGKTRKLPYKDANGKVDLPHVRNALARLSQTQGIPDSEKASIKTKLQSALKNTKAADDVRLSTIHPIEADATTKALPTRMMLLRSGNFYTQKYGEVPLSADDIREMKANFDNGVGMAGAGTTGIPVDYSHESNKNAGAWIKAMEVKEDDEGNAELWATGIEFSDSGKSAILGKEYKCLSSDFYPSAFGEWVDPESGVAAQNVIVGAAFTNRPMFSGNQPVTASETDNNSDGGGTQTVIYINASQKKETSMDINALRVKAADEVDVKEQRFLQAHASELSKAELEKFELAAPVKAADEDEDTKPKQIKASEVTGEEGKVVVEASELKTLVDEVGSLKAGFQKSEREQLKEKVLAHAKRGAIKADRIDSWTDRLLAADEKGRTEIEADLAGLSDNPVLAKVQGSGDAEEDSISGDPRSEIMNKATEKVNASVDKQGVPHLSFEKALEAVRAAEPDLAKAAAEQGRARVNRMQATDDQLSAAGVNRG